MIVDLSDSSIDARKGQVEHDIEVDNLITNLHKINLNAKIWTPETHYEDDEAYNVQHRNIGLHFKLPVMPEVS